MPVIIIEMWEGKTDDQKRRIAKAVNDALIKEGGFNPETLHVIIHDVSLNNWSTAGKMAADTKKLGESSYTK